MILGFPVVYITEVGLTGETGFIIGAPTTVIVGTAVGIFVGTAVGVGFGIDVGVGFVVGIGGADVFVGGTGVFVWCYER